MIIVAEGKRAGPPRAPRALRALRAPRDADGKLIEIILLIIIILLLIIILLVLIVIIIILILIITHGSFPIVISDCAQTNGVLPFVHASNHS